MTKRIANLASISLASGVLSLRAQGDDPAAIIEAMNKDWSEFKAAHEEKLNGISKKFDDVVTTEKMDRVEARISDLVTALDEANTRLAAISVGAGGEDHAQLSAEDREYQAKFDSWFRDGDGENGLKAMVRDGNISAAYSVGSDPDGGLSAPVEWDRSITDARVEVSPMRRFASVQTVSGAGFKRLYNMRGTQAGWVGETDARAETAGSKLREYAFGFGEIYAMPAATQAILEDSSIDLAAWLESEVNTEFARQEGIAFVSGDGINKPKGFLMYDATTEAALPEANRHPLGPVQEIVTGAAADLTSDGIIDLVYGLPEDRSVGAALFGNRKTHAKIRKMKDGQGNYLWQPPFQAGQPAQVLGNPFNELAGMPDVAANAVPLAFGNMKEAYKIFDRVGMSILRDPYTKKPYVLFYTRKRVGGGIWNPEWLRYHRVAAE
jgi:HK97 family phage major capsid protein